MTGLLARSVARAGRTSNMRFCASWANRTNPVYPSPWNKWFPHEPVPSTPQIGPYKTMVEEKVVYHYCTCGESASQPWCEAPGSKCGKMPEFSPRLFIPNITGAHYMCGCKKAGDSLCNGSCAIMYADLFPIAAAGVSFGVCFTFGVVSTWFMHP
mmetsp:Transcript_70674/g.207337  ORF Transcript_70674/g.207337 Transcript_70674/m.207337 type:complete len:155 (+) Transcript_70674:71-535(+)